jgi:hypothetical protein
MEPTGQWLLAGGGVALAGGALFGLLGSRKSDELNGKFSAHTLTTADRSGYSAVHRDALLANGLFVGGGLLALTGAVLWGAAPDLAPGSAGLWGRF